MARDTAYSVNLNIASPTASTTLPQVQLNTPTNKGIELLRVQISQETSTTSAVTAIELVRSTATAPGTLTPTGGVTTIAPLNASDPASSSTVYTGGFSGALTGTQTSLHRAGFNVLNGYVLLPVPEERIILTGALFLWVRLPVTVPAATYNITLTWNELG